VTALGFLLVGFGALTVWAGFYRTNVFTVLRSILAKPVVTTDAYGKPTGTSTDGTTLA
jgi:hypothetical protein